MSVASATITALYIYPVKSLGRIALTQSRLTVQGLQWDRHWMIIDAEQHFVTQRTLTEMALIDVDLTETHLTLSKLGMPDLSIPLDKSFLAQKTLKTQIWSDEVEAYDEGEDASEWLTRALGLYRGQPLRLVRFPFSTHRQVDPNYLPELHTKSTLDLAQTHTHFSDGFPFLVASDDSLKALNNQLNAQQKPAVSMPHFRANVVIQGLTPWLENSVNRIKSVDNAYQFFLVKPCERCPITTINPDTAEIPDRKEPLNTLKSLDTGVKQSGAFFGQNAILAFGNQMTIRIGDQVIIDNAD